MHSEHFEGTTILVLIVQKKIFTVVGKNIFYRETKVAIPKKPQNNKKNQPKRPHNDAKNELLHYSISANYKRRKRNI